MSKNKKGHKSHNSNRKSDMSPEFKKRIEETYGNNALDLDGAPDALKMSDRILQIIEPYMDVMDIVMLVDCATIAWNECIHEDFDFKGSYSLNNVFLNYEKYRDLIEELKARKHLMFKSNRRHVKEVKVYKNGDDININVVSDFDVVDMLSEIAEAESEETPYETYSEADDEEFDEAVETYEDDGDISKPNPHLKRIILSVVDNQLRANDPPITRKTFERLQSEGYTAKQAKEKIAAILVEDIYDVMTTKKPHNEKAYETRLKALK